MAALTSKWNCDNCGVENDIKDPNCKLCDEPKAGVMRASIPEIISIIKGLNLQSMLDSKTNRQTFSNEVYLAETNPDIAGLTHPREDLNEMSVYHLAKQKQDDLDYFARSFMGYIMQKREITEIQATHIGNMRSHRDLENIVKRRFSEENMQLQSANAQRAATLTDEWKYGNLNSRNDLLRRVKIKVKEEQHAALKKLEEDITKAQILLEHSKKKFAHELKMQQEVKTGVVNEIFQHMKEADVPKYTKKDAENLFDEYVNLYENRERGPNEEILRWTETLESLINLCEGLANEEAEDIRHMMSEDEKEEAIAAASRAQQELNTTLTNEEKRRRRKKEKNRRKKQRQRETRKKREDAERAAKEAEDKALLLRAQQMAIQEKEEAALTTVAKPKDEGMSKEEEIPLSSLDEQLISRITELYEYLQTQNIFKSERIKREARMELAKPYQKKMIQYMITELIPILKSHGIGLVVTGGFATHLLSNGHYDTEDIDIKVYNISKNRDIPTMREIVKREIGQSSILKGRAPDFQIFDPVEIEFGRNASKAAEMANNGNIPLKITARINIGEYRNERNPTEYDAISEITYNDTTLYGDVNKQYVKGIPIQDQITLIDNLLNRATINFKQRMAEGERNIYPEKILGWFKQLQELLRQTTKSNAVEVMNKTLSRIKSPSPKQGGKRKTKKRRKKKRKTKKRKKNRKKRTRKN